MLNQEHIKMYKWEKLGLLDNIPDDLKEHVANLFESIAKDVINGKKTTDDLIRVRYQYVNK